MYIRNWRDHETIKMNCLHKLGWISNEVDICFKSVLCSSEVVYSSVLVKYFVREDGVVVIGAQ
jgi:hypothetical protein